MSRRRLLLISPAFFGYEQAIVASIEAAGFDVTFVDERPSNSSIERAILRVGRTSARTRIDAYFRGVAAGLEATEFDVVLVIKAEVVPPWFLARLRERSPAARFVFYTFDSIDNAPNCVPLLKGFDDRWTFDPVDARGPHGLSYLPLFYTADFAPGPPLASRRHDISFVGTLHSGRYQAVKRLFGAFGQPYSFIYVQARWYLRYQQLREPGLRRVSPRDVSFEKMDRAGVADIFRLSKCVLDIQRTGQHGLTMRTFEVLAAGAILLTTNGHVREAEFYDPERVVVLPERPETWDATAIASTVASLPVPSVAPAGFERYALDSWVQRVLAPCG